METRVAVISIIVEDTTAVEPLNELLHTYGKYITDALAFPTGKRALTLSAWYWTHL